MFHEAATPGLRIEEGGKVVGFIDPYDRENFIGTLVIPWGAKSIDGFSYCSWLTGLRLPPTVVCIGKFAFDHCKRLKGLDLPPTITSIGHCAFWNANV